jgi:hypothetical protein
MGLDQSVIFGKTPIPSWETVNALLVRRSYPVQVRMIDGQLAFPDERPPEEWQELRLGTAQGMVTVRRDGDCLVFVIWGNPDAALLQAWNALTWAFAEIGGGIIQTPAGPRTATEFQKTADLPPALRSEQ